MRLDTWEFVYILLVGTMLGLILNKVKAEVPTYSMTSVVRLAECVDAADKFEWLSYRFGTPLERTEEFRGTPNYTTEVWKFKSGSVVIVDVTTSDVVCIWDGENIPPNKGVIS